jgi:hypothetical protein
MADSNRSRANRKQVVLYMGLDEAEQFTELARRLGESKNAVLRMALREFMRRTMAELRLAQRASRHPPKAPHASKVRSIFCTVANGGAADDPTLEAWILTRLTRDYPQAAVRVQVGSTPRPTIIAVDGDVTPDEAAAVVGHLEPEVAIVVDEYTAARAGRG